MGPALDWEYRSANLRGLSYRFAVRADDPRLGHLADTVLAGLRDPQGGSPVEHWYSLTASDAAPGTVDVTRDGHVIAHGQRPGDAVGWVVWDVNRAAADESGGHLLLHAGALEACGIGVLVPGASGSGKSTLVAGLVRAGFSYLTDELAALDMASGQLLPYPKPITVKPGSFTVLRDMDPDLGDPTGGPRGGEEWQVPVGEAAGRRIGRPCPPRFVVVPRYDADAETALSPLTDTEAFFALAVNAVNLLPYGAATTAALGRLAGGCRCYSLTMSDLDEACRLVEGLVAEAAAAAPGGGAHGC